MSGERNDSAERRASPIGLRAIPGITGDEWRRRTEWPITGIALVFLVVYAWDVLADLHGTDADVAKWVMWGVWLVFVVDYLVQFALADRRGHWFVAHLPQFLVVALPVLRPLRLLRLIALWGLLQRAAGTWVRGRVAVYAVGSAVLLVLIASLAELDAERHAPHSEITTFGDSLWWAFETITTVGYGDRIPVTIEGRVIAVGLMIAGIALLGVITATIASWMVESVSAGDSRRNRVTLAHVDALSAQVRQLSEDLAAFRAEQRAAVSHARTSPEAEPPGDRGEERPLS